MTKGFYITHFIFIPQENRIWSKATAILNSKTKFHKVEKVDNLFAF